MGYLDIYDDIASFVINTESQRKTSDNDGILIQYALKHIIRYKYFKASKGHLLRILYLALKGADCPKYHLDISHAHSIINFLKSHPDYKKDPYLCSFIQDYQKKIFTEIP